MSNRTSVSLNYSIIRTAPLGATIGVDPATDLGAWAVVGVGNAGASCAGAKLPRAVATRANAKVSRILTELILLPD